jgi:hypothetical protein
MKGTGSKMRAAFRSHSIPGQHPIQAPVTSLEVEMAAVNGFETDNPREQPRLRWIYTGPTAQGRFRLETEILSGVLKVEGCFDFSISERVICCQRSEPPAPNYTTRIKNHVLVVIVDWYLTLHQIFATLGQQK